ncbi:hypothetical protein ACJIZ3_018420 [Penstemon smallii]|uniref:DUF4378 domain-containing protein n=1 Tax=Penstemon smallii TaxID=265156 RepID=A0ABD3SZI8_9LAMI
MASLLNQNNITNSSKFQDSHLFENRPRMLKDFLRDDSLHPCPSSSSSNGFKMYPRKRPCNKSKVQLPNSKSMVLLRSQSKKAAATTLSALQKVISVVKFLPFTSVKSPLVVHKRISSKLSKSSKDKNDISLPVKVIVKDILRWRSFRDLVEEGSTPLDFSSSTATTTSCSRKSSWCESDFTAEDLPPWCGENNENQELLGEKCFVGEHGTNIAALRNISKEGWSFEEYEQQSPVSVLKSTFRENEKCFSPFHRSYGNTHENTIFQEEEEKTLLLLSRIKESNLVDNRENHVTYLILDDFMHEISSNGKLLDFEFDCEILRNVKSWMNGEYNESYEWGLEENREAYVKDIEKGVEWNKFNHEQQDISKELEIRMLNELLDELLNDLLANNN